MRHPGGRGYLTALPASGHRKQNPHMHLLEAALVNLEAGGDARFLALADEMVGLFCDHFYDGVTGTLGEYFDESWRRAAGEAGRAIEPGHHFEWAWLLAAYQRISGRDMREFVRGLVGICRGPRGGSAKRRHIRRGPGRWPRPGWRLAHLAQRRAHSGRSGAVRAGAVAIHGPFSSKAAGCCWSAICRTCREVHGSINSQPTALRYRLRSRPRRSTMCSSHSRKC